MLCLESILKEGAILSRSIMNDKQIELSSHEYIGYNGYDYISVCKKYYSNEISDCYEEYIRNNIGLIIVNPINITETKLINSNDGVTKNFNNYYKQFYDEQVRYSDLTGEFQVYQKIPLKNIIAITYPLTILINDIENSYMSEKERIIHYRNIIMEYYNLVKLLKKYDINKPIIDLENWQLVDKNLNLKITRH